MNIDFEKMGGLVPAIIQDAVTAKVLMLGFMNKEAYEKTLATGLVTFWSRTRKCLWTKGETSGNFLHLVSVKEDCDHDTLLVEAHPDGPVCHLGTDTCWGESNDLNPITFLTELQDFIEKRHEEMPEGSYTTSLFRKGVNKMAKSGRGSRRDRDRGHERHQRQACLRGVRPVVSSRGAACVEGIAHRGHSA